MFRGSGLAGCKPFRSVPLGMRGPLFEGESGAPPASGQPNTPPPATERPGTTPGAPGGAGSNPAGGNPAQPQPNGNNNQPTPNPNTPPIQWTTDQQTEIDRIVQARLAEDKTRETTKAQRDQAIKDEADKLEQLKFKDVAETRGTRITELEGQLATEMRKRIAVANHLPEDMAARLVGTTEAELLADAQKLASHLKLPSAPNNEAGSGNRPNGTKPPGTPPNGGTPPGGSDAKPKRYVFQEPGGVAW